MKKIITLSIFLAFISLPILVFAQGSGGDPSLGSPTTPSSQTVQIQNPLADGITTLPQLITAILNNIVMPLAAVFVVLMIIYSGFKYITAQGNAGKIKEANQALLYVLIGAVVLLGAAGISAAVSGTICGPSGIISSC